MHIHPSTCDMFHLSKQNVTEDLTENYYLNYLKHLWLHEPYKWDIPALECWRLPSQVSTAKSKECLSVALSFQSISFTSHAQDKIHMTCCHHAEKEYTAALNLPPPLHKWRPPQFAGLTKNILAGNAMEHCKYRILIEQLKFKESLLISYWNPQCTYTYSMSVCYGCAGCTKRWHSHSRRLYWVFVPCRGYLTRWEKREPLSVTCCKTFNKAAV